MANCNNGDDSDYDVDDYFGHLTPNPTTPPKQQQHQPPCSSAQNPIEKLEPSLECDQLDLPAVPNASQFSDLGVHPTLVHHLAARMNITTPTAIQRAVFSTVLGNRKLQHRDVAISAATGSGKTLSFLVPIVQSLLFPSPEPSELPSRATGPLCLILSPTRELAQQTHNVLNVLANISRGSVSSQVVPQHWLVCSTIVGGESKKSEKARIRKGLNVIVSTPGRMLDHLRTTANLDISRVRWVVLDEADRLLDLGFERDLKAIFGYLNGGTTDELASKDALRFKLPLPPTTAWPARRQVFLCSATMHKVATLAKWILDRPIHVSDKGTTANGLSTHHASLQDTLSNTDGPSLLKHHYMVVPLKLKLLALLSYLCNMTRGPRQSNIPKKAIVFFSTRGSVDYYHALLMRILGRDRTDQSLGFQYALDLGKLHGSMTPEDRKTTLSKFSGFQMGNKGQASDRAQVLITTDVAARGLDLAGVDMIIQYDAPTDVNEYVHRAGRTARAGKKGLAVLLLSPQEEEFATCVLVKNVGHLHLVDVGSNVAQLLNVPADQWEKAAIRQWQMPFEEHVKRDRELHKLAMLGFQSYVKGYATYPSSLKSIFHVRKLHLGHLAKSFCLKEPPAELHQILGQLNSKADTADPKKRKFSDGVLSYAKTAQANMQTQMASEFQVSGYLPSKKKRRR